MAKALISSIKAQYVLCLDNEARKTIQGDRKIKENPLLDIFSDSTEMLITIKLFNLKTCTMNRTGNRPEGLDLYLAKEHSSEFLKAIETLREEITSNTILNRQKRLAKDPRYSYDEDSLPIQINDLGGNIRVGRVSCQFKNLELSSHRVSSQDVKPLIHIDLEHGKTRIHFGFRSSWTRQETNGQIENVIEIDIPWVEYGHLLGIMKNLNSKIN